MANAERGEVVVKLGSEEWVVRPSFDFICGVEEATGRSILELVENIRSIRLTDIVLIIHEGIKSTKPALPPTKAVVGALAVKAGVTKLLPVAANILSAALGVGTDDDEEPPQGNVGAPSA